MADMERQFRAAMDEPDADEASQPATMASDDQGGDVRCPCCGASAMKIVQAAQGGPMGAMK